MKNRYTYTLLFGVPGAFIALLVSFFVAGAAAGGLWLYAHGDEAWPAAAGHTLVAVFAASFLALWFLSLVLGYRFGRRWEAGGGVPRRHVMMSLGATLLPAALMAGHQWRVGNLGPPGPGAPCAERCRAAGYTASGTTPGPSGSYTCTCFDRAGRVVSPGPPAAVP